MVIVAVAETDGTKFVEVIPETKPQPDLRREGKTLSHKERGLTSNFGHMTIKIELCSSRHTKPLLHLKKWQRQQKATAGQSG